MKVVILAGGLGTRISEETVVKPKPMVEVGGKPILWHIMKIYSHYGYNDFIVCLGYKGYVIKEYFSNYFLHMSDVTFDMRNNSMQVHHQNAEPWKVTLVDTGDATMTGGRLKRIRRYIENKTFMVTYGDGVSDIDISKLVAHHQKFGKSATVTATQPSGRFGSLAISDEHTVTAFQEKPAGDGSWINGGFFVLEPSVLDRIESDATLFEKEPLESLAREGSLTAYKHSGFWQPMDTLRDKNHLEELWLSGNAPWKLWK
jgi:glucose-1-phosphate cytidylyltransferase